MHYPGGKTKLSKEIEAVVLKYKTPKHTTYIEPFMGGGGSFCPIVHNFAKARSCDVNEDLVMMWNALMEGWDPPEVVPEKLYRELRHAKESSALRAFAGIGSAFSGVWFGGYREGKAAQARRALLVDRENLAKCPDVKVLKADYRTLNKVGPHVLIYADPPYAQAAFMYKRGARHFNSSEFWAQAFMWRDQGAEVLVSEYVAPESDRIEVVWERTVRKTLNLYQVQDKDGAASGHRKEAKELIYRVLP
jgi:DNA adenine methylase